MEEQPKTFQLIIIRNFTMSPKKIILTLGILTLGVGAGAVLTTRAHAADQPGTNPTPRILQEFGDILTGEQKQQIQDRVTARRTMMDNITREVTKTDDGIQINLKGSDQATIDQMHAEFDANGGTWGKMGGRGRMRGIDN
jgi:hypothetical protein